MALNKITFETDVYRITIQRTSDSWYMQVMQGLSLHVESRDFKTYSEAVEYAIDKYNLMA